MQSARPHYARRAAGGANPHPHPNPNPHPHPSPSPDPNPNPNQGYEGHVGLEYKPSTQATAQSFAGWGVAHGIA